MQREFRKIEHFSEMNIGDYVTIECMVAGVKPKPEGTRKPGKVQLLDGENQFEISIFENASGYEIITNEKIAYIYAMDFYCDEYNENLSPRLLSYAELEATPERRRQFLVTAPIPVDEMFDGVIKNTGSELVKNMFQDHEQELKANAAGEKMHHAYIGGLLYHLYRMVLCAKSILKTKDILKDAEASEKKFNTILGETNTAELYRTLFGKWENIPSIKIEVKTVVLLAKALQKVYYLYTDLEVIVSALIVSIHAKYVGSNALDESVGLPFSQSCGYAPTAYQVLKKCNTIPLEKEREIKFCIVWAFEPLETRRETKSADSVIVHFIMLMLEYGFIENTLDESILLTATALHDIGKLQEMQTTPLGKTEYTDDGRLFNHLHLGVQMVLDESEGRNYDTRLIHNVVHCIASHHGRLDWSAIVEPSTPEAKMLFMVDDMDSQIEPIEAAMPGMEIGEVKEIPYHHLTVFKTKEPSE